MRALWKVVACCAMALLPASYALARGPLPEGDGKQIILNRCAGCHVPESFTDYAHTPEEWNAIVSRMGQRASATSNEVDILTAYFTKNFPKIDDPTKVNVNKADAKAISDGLGLTEKEAEAIVDYRERHGNYRTWGDLLVIYGVDGRKVEAAKDKMSF